MNFRWLWLWAFGALCATAPGFGQERSLTLEEALALARERGAGVVLAKGRIEEARARQAQAGRRFQENPVLEVESGPRFREGTSLDFGASVSQGLVSGSRRAARLAGTEAALDRATADLDESRRLLVRDVWTTFAHALAEQERGTLLQRSREAADSLLAATESRYEAGEATALELNRARTVAAAARADQSVAGASLRTLLAELKALLGLGPEEAVVLQGDLGAPSPLTLETLLARVDQRPDLRALEAELREAEAEVLLGKALSRPEWGVRGGVGREEDAEIVTAGFVVTLPVHNRGEETLAVGEARTAALRQALTTARAAADAEVRGRYAALAQHLEAVRELERTGLPALDDNESLVLKSFEAGEIDLGELLQVRREILETRLAYLDRRFEATLTRYELEAAAGAVP